MFRSPFGFYNPYGQPSPYSHYDEDPFRVQPRAPARRGPVRQQQVPHPDAQPFHDPFYADAQDMYPQGRQVPVMQQHRQPAKKRVQQPQQHAQQMSQQEQLRRAQAKAATISQKQHMQMQHRAQQFRAKMLNKQASKIQHWWRNIAAAKMQAKQEAAALVIQKFMQQYVANLKTRKFLRAVKALRSTEVRISQLNDTFTARFLGRAPGTSKDMLLFEDQMDKLVISLDGVNIAGSDMLRAERKRVVRSAQAFLDKASHMHSSAVCIQRWWRRHLEQERERRKPNAARVLVKAMRTLMVKQQARKTTTKARALRHMHADIDALVAQFASQLSELKQRAHEISTEDSDTLLALQQAVETRAQPLIEAASSRKPASRMDTTI